MNKVTGERVFASELQVRSQTQVLQTQLQEEIDKAKALSEELTNELNNAKNVNKEPVLLLYPVSSLSPHSSAYTFAKSCKISFYVRDERDV